MKQIYRCLTALLLAVIVLSLPQAAAEDAARTPEQAEMLARVRQSVVHLYAVGLDETGAFSGRWTGTGFAVGIAGEDSDTFLTNWHVVTGSGEYAQENVRIWLLQDDAKFDQKIPSPETAVECEVLATTSGFPDVAVVRTKSPVAGYKALPLLSSWQVPNQTEVYALGFPGLQATRYGVDSGPEDVAVTAGTIRSHMLMAKAGGTWALIHDAAIRHGNSGGPLINTQGVVVGQNTYGFAEDASEGLSCALDLDYGMRLLEQLNIPYTAAPGPTRIHVLMANLLHIPQLSPGWAYLAFAFAILLILFFLRYFLLALKDAAAELRQKLTVRK